VVDVLQRERIYRRLLALGDASALLAAVLLAIASFHVDATWFVIGVPFFAVIVAKVQGLYDRDDMVIRKSTVGEWRTVLQAAVITTIAIYLSWPLLTTGGDADGMGLFFFVGITTLAIGLPARAVARRVARWRASEERCLIVGDPRACANLAKRIDSLRSVRCIGAVPAVGLAHSLADLQQLVADQRVHRLVIVPDANSSETATFELVRAAKWIGIRVSIYPSILGAVGGCAVLDEVDGLVLLAVPKLGLSRSSGIVKRTFDIGFATLGLLAIAPLMCLIAIMIKLDSSGPVFFAQSRVGRNGGRFRMFKFRSMVDGADAMKDELATLNEAVEGFFKIANDPRVTRVGSWLRRGHLDELPQLWNVIRGEMSIVGPRPLIAEEDEQLAGPDRYRLRLTPGITGPWQIRGPMSAPLSEMAKLDYLYISNWSLWQDFDILLKTARRVIYRSGY
jgi:exopolysaccharide biosynthesis polyprenyl glycosylphosphotransferase